MRSPKTAPRWWYLLTAVLGVVVMFLGLNLAGDLSDALAGQPDVGDDGVIAAFALLAAGLTLTVGGLVLAFRSVTTD